MRLDRRVFQLKNILEEFSSQDESFPPFLKSWFRQNKGCGSRDRRELSALAYAYFRMGLLFKELSLEERIHRAIFVFPIHLEAYREECFENNLLAQELNEFKDGTLSERVDSLLDFYKIELNSLFPFYDKLSSKVNINSFMKAQLELPLVWFRGKRQFSSEIEKRLKQNKLEYTKEANSFGMTQGVDIETIFGQNKHHFGEVQDLSSTRSLSGLDLKGNEIVWDCCAASGGKSIALLDEYPKLKMICTDIRSNILFNLEKRFKLSGLGLPHKAVLDLSEQLNWPFENIPASCDVLLCDLPCSGSGTWGRNPERLLNFSNEELNNYVSLQTTIVKNASEALKKDGLLVYITCSVYQDENEAQQETVEAFGFELVSMEYFEGAEQQSDTLFRAIYRKL